MPTSKKQVLLISGMGVYGKVANYSALPDPTLHDGETWIALASQGTSWLPGSFGGTYYPKGQYYSDGTNWIYDSNSYQASQSDVNTGTITDQWVSPSTLANSIWAFTVSKVLATTLTGLNVALTGAITSSDSILTAFGKIQNQISNLPPPKFSYTDTVLGTATSGAGNQFSKSVLIPANTLTSGALNIKGRATKNGSSSYGWLNIYINTANNLSGAAHLGQINSSGGNTLANFAIDRTIPIQAGSFVTFIVNTTNGFEEIVTNQVSTTTINWTVDQYVILSCQSNGGADPMRANFLSVNQF